jgi:hypothetical protein
MAVFVMARASDGGTMPQWSVACALRRLAATCSVWLGILMFLPLTCPALYAYMLQLLWKVSLGGSVAGVTKR